MEITWLGHSALQIKGTQVTLITDPYADTLGLSMGQREADVVTVTNSHPHHSNAAAIVGDPRVIKGPGEYEVANFYISGFGTRGREYEGERQVNTVYTYRAEGLTLCHLGDLSANPSPSEVNELSQVDVLFAPAGGVCTLDAARIAQLARTIEPRILVPLHYRYDGVNVELEPLDRFLSEFGITELAPQPRLNITATNLPAELRVTTLQIR